MKISLQKITKVFFKAGKNAQEVKAVDDFDLEIPDGQLVGLLGPSGCGKSTTLNMLCGLEEPTSGKIYFADQDVTALPPELRGVGMVFQNYALYPHLSVKKNILFPLENLKGKAALSKKEMENRMMEAAKLVQIIDLLDRKPKELSGGQQQRVAIARALVKLPNVLLLDEPLSNLDARLRLQTREEIRKIQRATKITTIFVTHDQEEAMSICDQIVVMNEGRIQQVGKPQDVYDDPTNLFVAKFLGNPPINVFAAKIKDGKLYLGEQMVMAGYDIADQDVIAAIRPEGFVIDERGPFRVRLQSVEIMGREISVVAAHPACQSDTFRAIVQNEQLRDHQQDEIAFSLKKEKVFIFDVSEESRLDRR